MATNIDSSVIDPAAKALDDTRDALQNTPELKPGESETESFDRKMKRFAQLENLRRRLDESMTQIKAETALLSSELVEYMAENAIETMRIDGLTIYPRTTSYVSKKGGVSTSEMCEILQDSGLGDLVSDGYNAQKLKSKINEWVADGIEIPSALAEKLNIGETVVLTSRV